MPTTEVIKNILEEDNSSENNTVEIIEVEVVEIIEAEVEEDPEIEISKKGIKKVY